MRWSRDSSPADSVPRLANRVLLRDELAASRRTALRTANAEMLQVHFVQDGTGAWTPYTECHFPCARALSTHVRRGHSCRGSSMNLTESMQYRSDLPGRRLESACAGLFASPDHGPGRTFSLPRTRLVRSLSRSAPCSDTESGADSRIASRAEPATGSVVMEAFKGCKDR